MALIEVILKEYKETDPEEVSLKVKGWIKRCNDEGVSLYALERILALETKEEESRSMSRYVSSLVDSETTTTQVSESSVEKKKDLPEEEKKGFINKLTSFLKSKKKS